MAKGGRPPRLRRLRFRRPPDFALLDVYGPYYFHKLWNQRFVFGFKHHTLFSQFTPPISSSQTSLQTRPKTDPINARFWFPLIACLILAINPARITRACSG